jgi:beta-lactamase regulating signal transducer with metallopeptidase domain
MIPAVNEMMLAVGSSLAASIVAKMTVVSALALFASWLARWNRAAVRHALLTAVFGVMLLLPIASVVVPPVHLMVPVMVESRAAVLPPLGGVEAIPAVTTADAGARAVSVMPRASGLSFSDLLLSGWIAGGAVFLLPLVIGLWQIQSLCRSGLPWRRGQSVVETLAREGGIHRSVELLLHEALPGPMTCGVVHPAIVLPQDAETWSHEDLNRAIVHELEHVRRRDAVSRCLARAVCALYWFHPLVWIAWRKLVLEAERSCDDAVLGRSEATAGL